MRTLLFAALLLFSTAHAEVITCPERFPTKDMALSDNPAGRHGLARLKPARLSNAYMISGELYSEEQFVPDITKVEGGRDVRYSFTPDDTNWLVCEYGGGERVGGSIQLWEKINPKISGCELKIREIKVPHTASDWSAAAACK